MMSSSAFRSKAGLTFPAAVIVAIATFLYAGTFSENVAGAGEVTNAVSGPPSPLAVPAAIFVGANVGAIPDGTSPCWNPGTGTPRNITFNAVGLSGAPTSVDVSITFGGPAHTHMGDVTAVLIAPNGASHTLFGHTSATTATSFGDSSDLGNTYNFSDNAPAPPSGGWWQAATATAADASMPAGTYRTTASGGAGAVNPMPPTNMNAAFAGVANPNGTWTLRVTDSCAADMGTVSGATLTIAAGPAVPHDANVDMNGDGKTDFVVARGTTTPFAELSESTSRAISNRGNASLDERPVKGSVRGLSTEVLAPPIYWYTALNGPGTTSVVQHGDAATDFIISEDFDGDLKDDFAVWTEGPAGVASFKIVRSTTNTVDIQLFGQTGDDPAVVGDYDGDGKADPAVYRCPSVTDPDGQCYFFFRGSNANPGGNVTYVPWGFGADGDFFPNVGDFDGDGKNDFCIQRSNPSSPANGQFVLLRSSDSSVEFVNWGLSSDFIIPGDYDGDGKSDFCVRRTVGGARQHWILYRTGVTEMHIWGSTGDSSAPGDYDGDGKTDLAIWRGSADPNQTNFWIRNSGTGATSVVRWGLCATVATCDFAVAGWAVH